MIPQRLVSSITKYDILETDYKLAYEYTTYELINMKL